MKRAGTLHERIHGKKYFGVLLWMCAFLTLGVVRCFAIDFIPTDDTYVDQAAPTVNYGTNPAMWIRSNATSKEKDVYLKFNVSGLAGTVTSAKVIINSSNVVGNVSIYTVPSTSWSETSIVWTNKPATGSKISTVNCAAGLNEFDVTSTISGSGIFAFCLKDYVQDVNTHRFNSKDGNPKPVLRITTSPFPPKAFSTQHPTDPYIAAFHINDVLAGAYGQPFTIAADGSVDVTTNLQTAIDVVANVHKGGVLYLPKGKYRVDSTLILRQGVTLRGDWSIPTDTPDYANQTVFCVYYGRNGETNTPWMTIDGNAELNGAVIWYPEQTAAGIVPYADTIQMKQVDNRRAASAKCLTFINAYRGIGTVDISMGYMGNIYGTCLKSGGGIHGTGGSCQYVNLHFSPKYWEQSGLTGAPSSSGAHRPFMKNGGIGFVNDGAKYGAFLYIDGYDIGYEHNGGRYDYKFVITNCNVGIQLDGEAQGGINLNGYVEASNYALCSTGIPLQSATQIIFQDVVLKGGLKAVYLSKDNHRMDLSFQGCTFSNAVHVMYGKNLSFSACNFSSPSNHIILPSTGPDTILAGNTFTDKAMNLLDGKTNTIVDTQAVVYPVCPEYIDDPFVVTKAGRAAVYAVTNYGATIRWPGDPVNPNDDDAPAIQAAINQANADGGGIVYLPSGIYEIRTPIEIKPNVVVQGSSARMFEGSVFGLFELRCSELDVHYGRGQESLPAAVKLDANSGINGVAFLQPDQDSSQPDPNLPGCSIVGYPYIIATAGNNTFIKNIRYVTYKGINITNNNCYVEFAGGSPLREGIVVQGGATNCVLRNIEHGNHDDPVDADLAYRESMLNAMTFKYTAGLKVLQHQGHGCKNVVRLENEAVDKGPAGLGLLIQMEQGRFEVSGNAGGFQGIGVRINLLDGNNLHTQPEFSDTFNVFGYWGNMGTNYLPTVALNGTGTLNLIGYIAQNYSGTNIGGVNVPVNGPLNIYTLISKDHTFNMGPAGKLSIVSTIDSDALYGTSLNPAETLYGPVQASGVIPPSVRLVQRAMHSPVVPLGTNDVIQAEDYLYFYDTTAGNSGGKYRSDDVDIALNAGQTNAYHVMVNAANEWLGYDLSGFDSGSYDVKLQVAAATDGQTVELTQNGVLLRTVSIPRTADAQTYRTLNIPSVSLTGGPGTCAALRLYFPGGNLNFDSLRLAAPAPNTAPVFLANPDIKPDANQDVAYSSTLMNDAVDADGDSLSFSLIGGPSWLNIASDGTLSGTPVSANVGLNSWSVQVSDGRGGIATTWVNVTVLAPVTVTNVSVGAEDGWVLETNETLNVGGSFSATGSNKAALRIGDDVANKQYKTVVSFDTSAIPDGATVLSATLRLKRGTGVGVTTNLGAILVDIKGGTGFSGATALTNQDFQAAADATNVATMNYPSVNDTWSTGDLNSSCLANINKTGKTQLRVYFAIDDNNNVTDDYIGFYSGESAVGTNPELIITYRP